MWSAMIVTANKCFCTSFMMRSFYCLWLEEQMDEVWCAGYVESVSGSGTATEGLLSAAPTILSAVGAPGGRNPALSACWMNQSMRWCVLSLINSHQVGDVYLSRATTIDATNAHIVSHFALRHSVHSESTQIIEGVRARSCILLMSSITVSLTDCDT